MAAVDSRFSRTLVIGVRFVSARSKCHPLCQFAVTMPWKTSAAEMAIRYGANTSVLDWRERLFSLRRPTGRYCGDRNGAAAGGASDMAEIDPDRFTLRPVEALRYTYAQVMKELDLVKELVLRPKHMIHDRYNRHARPCAGHPWRQQGVCRSSRMAGTSPAMTTERTVCLRLSTSWCGFRRPESERVPLVNGSSRSISRLDGDKA